MALVLVALGLKGPFEVLVAQKSEAKVGSRRGSGLMTRAEESPSIDLIFGVGFIHPGKSADLGPVV